MTKPHRLFRLSDSWPRALTGLALVGACTVVDKGDYTFTDDPGEEGGDGGTTAGSAGTSGSSQGGKGGKGGTSGEAGEGVGGSGGTSGTAGNPGGGEGGEGGPCDPNPCDNGGDCTSTGSAFTCDCAAGYEGVTCEDNIDDCDPNPCEQGVECTDLVADFSCACPPGVTGKRCELPRFQPIRGPGMSPRVWARSVSTDGTIVLGGLQDALGYDKPFIWEAGKAPTPLPLGPFRGDLHLTPRALSGDGESWVGEARPMMGGPTPVGGNLTQTVPFGVLANNIGSAAYDVSANGERAVGFSSVMPMGATGGLQAVAWDDPQMPMPLPNPFSSMVAAAGTITRDGSIISGTAENNMGTEVVVTWGADAASGIPLVRQPPTPAADIEVHGISDDAMDVVGTYWDTANANFAFVSASSRLVNISPLVGAVQTSSNAWDVSADGQVIVGDARLGSGTTMEWHAVMWKNDGAYVAKPVLDALRENNVAPMGWTLTHAYGVSGDGKVIVGEAINPMGMTEGFIARLP